MGPRYPTNDDRAIRTAVLHPTMRFVPVKTDVQQAVLMSHIRQLLYLCAMGDFHPQTVRSGRGLARRLGKRLSKLIGIALADRMGGRSKMLKTGETWRAV